jgi:integrase
MEGASYLEDGRLTVLRRSGTYCGRIRTSPSGKCLFRSLKTSDEQAAIQSGRRLKFWREYAAKLAVEAMDEKVMREFVPRRRDYYSKFEKLPKNAKPHPTDKTLQWEMMPAVLREAGDCIRLCDEAGGLG